MPLNASSAPFEFGDFNDSFPDIFPLTPSCSRRLGYVTIIWDSLVCMFGLLGNTFTLLLIIERLKKKNIAMSGGALHYNIYIGICACVDISFNILVAPLHLIKVDYYEYIVKSYPLFLQNNSLRIYNEVITIFYPMQTILMLSILAFDRATLVRRPNAYQMQTNQAIITKIAIKMSFATLVSLCAGFFYASTNPNSFLHQVHKHAQNYVLYAIMIILLLALLATMCSYAYMFIVIRRFRKKRQAMNEIQMDSIDSEEATESFQVTEQSTFIDNPEISKVKTEAKPKPSIKRTISGVMSKEEINIIIMLCVVTLISCIICFDHIINSILILNFTLMMKIFTSCFFYRLYALVNFPLQAVNYAINPVLYYVLSAPFKQDAKNLLKKCF